MASKQFDSINIVSIFQHVADTNHKVGDVGCTHTFQKRKKDKCVRIPEDQ